MKENIKENGRSMIEMLGVLAIIGVLSVGGIAGYSKAMHRYRVNKTIEQITYMAGSIRSFFASQKNYIGVECEGDSDLCDDIDGCKGFIRTDTDGYEIVENNGCPLILKAKLVPDEMITVNADAKITSITNPFGGSLMLSDVEKIDGSNDHQGFNITFRDVPEEACIELATHDWTIAGAQLMAWEYADTAYTKIPLDLETAIKQCEESHHWMSFLFDIDADSWLSN